MEALEQELVEKLNNVFSFSFKVKFQDLKADDIFEVYRIVILVRFVTTFDKSSNSKYFILDVWQLLDRQKPKASSRVILAIIFPHNWLLHTDVWGIFSFLQRMELGHLLNKGDITKREGMNFTLLYLAIHFDWFLLSIYI